VHIATIIASKHDTAYVLLLVRLVAYTLKMISQQGCQLLASSAQGKGVV